MSRRSVSRLAVATIAAFTLVTPMAFALIQDFKFSEGISRIGTELLKILGNENARYGLLIVFGIVFFRALFIAGLKKVPAFQGEGAHGVNAAGRLIATSAGFIAILGIATQAKKAGIIQKLGQMEGTSSILLTSMVAGFYLFNTIKNSNTGSWKAPTFWTMFIFLVGAIVFKNMILWIITIVLIIIWIFMVGGGAAGGPGVGSPYAHQRGPPKQRLKKLIAWSKKFRRNLREKLDVLREESEFIRGDIQDLHEEEKGLTLAAQHHQYLHQLQKEKKIGLGQVAEEMRSPNPTDFASLHEKFKKLYALVMHQMQSIDRIKQVVKGEHSRERKFIKENHRIMNHLEKLVSEEIAEKIKNKDDTSLMKLHALKKNKRIQAVEVSKNIISKVMHVNTLASSMESLIKKELKIYRKLYNDMNKITEKGQPAQHIADKVRKLKKLEKELDRFEEVTITNLLTEIHELQAEKEKTVALIGRVNEKIYSLEQKEAEEVKEEVEEVKREDETEVEADKMDD